MKKQTIQLTKDTNVGAIQINGSIVLKGVTIGGIRTLIKHEGDKLLFDVENSPLNKGYNGLEILRRSPNLQIGSDGTVQLRRKEVQVLINGRKVKQHTRLSKKNSMKKTI